MTHVAIQGSPTVSLMSKRGWVSVTGPPLAKTYPAGAEKQATQRLVTGKAARALGEGRNKELSSLSSWGALQGSSFLPTAKGEENRGSPKPGSALPHLAPAPHLTLLYLRTTLATCPLPKPLPGQLPQHNWAQDIPPAQFLLRCSKNRLPETQVNP